MSRIRASTVLATLVAIMAMLVGSVTLSATAASAAPKNYPPPPPSLVVNKGVVKKGVTVRATGRAFTKREKIVVTVLFRAKGSNKSKVIKTLTLRADRKGKFALSLKLAKAGLVAITAKGKTSRKSAAAVVYVIDKKKDGKGWIIRPASFSTGLTGGPSSGVESVGPTSAPGLGLAIAGISVLGAAGSVLVTRQTIRRRRKLPTAA